MVRSKCPHSVYLAKRDSARYCQFCNQSAHPPGNRIKPASGMAWNNRLANENRKFFAAWLRAATRIRSLRLRTVDKVWAAGGDNFIIVGSGGELEYVGANRKAKNRIGGEKRSCICPHVGLLNQT